METRSFMGPSCLLEMWILLMLRECMCFSHCSFAAPFIHVFLRLKPPFLFSWSSENRRGNRIFSSVVKRFHLTSVPARTRLQLYFLLFGLEIDTCFGFSNKIEIPKGHIETSQSPFTHGQSCVNAINILVLSAFKWKMSYHFGVICLKGLS